MPALIGSGRVGQAALTAANSGSVWAGSGAPETVDFRTSPVTGTVTGISPTSPSGCKVLSPVYVKCGWALVERLTETPCVADSIQALSIVIFSVCWRLSSRGSHIRRRSSPRLRTVGECLPDSILLMVSCRRPAKRASASCVNPAARRSSTMLRAIDTRANARAGRRPCSSAGGHFGDEADWTASVPPAFNASRSNQRSSLASTNTNRFPFRLIVSRNIVAHPS